MEIIELEKVCRSQAVSIAAAHGAMSLIERGLSRYGHDWNAPAIAAMDGDRCIGVLLVTVDDAEKSANVSLAWCAADNPKTLTALLTRLRFWCRERQIREIFFTAHDDNEFMAKAATAVGATTWSRKFRVEL